MPSRPDLREIASNVKDAFADADRETLLDILTFVITENDVEGPPPILIHQAETLADLHGQSFAQLIAALQTRCDHPELAMFVVDGEQVGVRIGGVVHPLLPGRQPLAGAAELPRPQAGVRVVETTLQPRPPAPQQPAQPQGTAPPPARGLSIRGTPGSASGSSAGAGAPPSSGQGAPGAAASSQGRPPAAAGQSPAPAQPPGAPSGAPSGASSGVPSAVPS